MQENTEPLNEVVLFFDGHCGLCNRAVDFLVARDHRRRLRFAPLQGATAAALLSPERLSTATGASSGSGFSSDSVVLWEDGKVLDRSDAVLRALTLLGGVWRAVGIFRALPRGLRDTLYDGVARNRTRWFGRRAECRVPSAAERARFLP